ncbi:hypothetical protein ABDK00_011015 [Niabella insulamsoli]|uniref:hypothetical protein n=1 Tax=Niabella insulamsoli TaxID=3144874 RepID=UPI0031FC3135
MRIFKNDPLNAPAGEDQKLPILFTGSAIGYLSNVNTSIDISEWQWHEEVVDGRRTRIITDRLVSHLEKISQDIA